MSTELNKLVKILNDAEKDRIYPCIKDILSNGIISDRFENGEYFPTRQDVTHFILVWLKHIGVTVPACRKWIISYSQRVLSAISSSSPGRIRHSTKSNLKYIFKSDVFFDCGCEHNELKAVCDPDCPEYDEMLKKYQIRKEKQQKAVYNIKKPVQPFIPRLSAKEKFKEQFETAMGVIRENLDQGISIKELCRLLNSKGLKTRTGKTWSIGTLNNEIKKYNLTVIKNDSAIRAYESKKTQYRPQYEKAEKLVIELYSKKTPVQDILNCLEKEDYKTITGKEWNEGNLRGLLSKLRKNGNIKD